MSTRTVKKAAGVTAARGTTLTASAVRELTPSTGTQRRYKPRARKCRCGCGQLVTPTAQAPHKVYFEDACRKRAHRRKAAKLRPSAPAERALVLATCVVCGASFLATEGAGAKHCKPSHRVAAAEHRRAAAVEALVGDLGSMTEQEAADLVEQTGMKKISRYLHQQGYGYDEASRRWVISVQPGDVFAQAAVTEHSEPYQKER